MAPPPAAAVFDLGGVVFRYQPECRFRAFSLLTGLDATTVRKRLMDSGYSHSCDAGRLDVDGACREGLRLLGARLGLERFRRSWNAAFVPDAATVAVVRRLREAGGVSVAMLTNNSLLVRGGLEADYPEVMELFRPRLFSAEAGLLKPDPRLFRTLVDLLGVYAERVLYVDDDSACVNAAAALGMTAWRFTGAEALEAMLREQELLS